MVEREEEMKLNQKQKRYLFTAIMDKQSLIKIFETADIQWLIKQKVEIKDGDHGWKKLMVDGEEYTQLNFPLNPEWEEILDNIDDYTQCEWCEEWFPNEELTKFHGLKVCPRCKGAIWSREGN